MEFYAKTYGKLLEDIEKALNEKVRLKEQRLRVDVCYYTLPNLIVFNE